MNTITTYLQTLRKNVFFNDSKLFFWKAYLTLIVFVFITIMFESLLYLSILNRKIIIYGFSLLSVVILSSYIIYGFLVFRDKIKKYQLSTLALKAGKATMKKEDMLLNAYQLENQKDSSGSPDLEQSFISIVNAKLENPKNSALIRKDLIEKWKTILFYSFVTSSFGRTWKAVFIA